MLKTISIPDREVEVLNHFENQPNKSHYIVRLIKEDMERTQNPNATNGVISDEMLEVALFKALRKYEALK